MLRHLPATKTKREQEKQSGFALLLLVFFIALMLITAMAAAPRILTEAKRQKEREMIWRGNQYVRGVKLYYRKMGRFPTSIDDLTKPKTGSLRFMRQAYKDPMNTGDGSWRLIYVGPAGQLIGSLKPPKTLQIPGAGPGLGASASSVATNSTQSGGTSAFGSSSLGSSLFSGGAGANPQPGGQQNSAQTNPQSGGENAGQNPGQPGQPGTSPDGTPAAGTDANGNPVAGDAMSTPEAAAPAEAPTIIGGNIIGVGSKISARSVIVYDKAKNYHLFEFIWDPSKDATIAGQPPMQTGTGLGQNIGTSPSSFGQQPGGTNTNLGQPGGNNPVGGAPVTPPLDSGPAPQPPPETQ